MNRILVVGAGLIGARHIQAVQAHPDCILAGVVDPDGKKRSACNVPAFTDLDSVNVAVDAAIIATPTALHTDHTLMAIRNGWHCLIEKPVANDLSGADRIITAADTAGVSTLVGHHRRYHASVIKLRNLIRKGDIGRPVVASLIWTVRKPDDYFCTAWRTDTGGSPVMINLVHDIDLLRFLLGEVSHVSAVRAQSVRQAARVESGVITLAFRSGATASITFSDATPSPFGFEAGTAENPHIAASHQDMLWIMGTKGAVSFPSLGLWHGANDWSHKQQCRKLSVENTHPLTAQLDHFIAVLHGQEEPLITAQDARETLAAALQAEAQLRP